MEFKNVIMKNKMEYRESDYFDADSVYKFEGTTKVFDSKVHKHKGSWYTNENLQYKATSIKCIKL